jgi:membrane-associated protease RseP (regulator of RpoE activity)
MRLDDMLFHWISLSGGLLTALLIHELGHFLAARWCGVRVVSFSIGIGPELFGFTDRFGTRWRLAALLLGGSVGMRNKPQSPELTAVKTQANLSDALSVKSLKQRGTIYLAGPVSSLLLAVCLVGVVLSFYGRDAVRDATLDQPDIVIACIVSGVSIFIGVFNLLPLPPLDGGRLLFLGIEALRAKPVSDHVQAQLSRVGLIVVSLLTLLLSFYGITLAMNR